MTIVSRELAVPAEHGLAQPAERTLLSRTRQVARFYNGGTPLSPAEAFDLLLERLIEAERSLAKIAHALNGDGGRAA
jgi:hypothetical protein